MIEQIDLPADPAVDTIPAICDRISRQLAEARTLSEVTALRDKAEALRLYAQRRGAAVEAQNGCARIVFLAERQIGAKLAKGQKTGEVAKRGRPKNAGNAGNFQPPTLPELGFRGSSGRDRAAEFKQLAEAPASAIEHAVAQANAEQRPVTKADLKKAVEDAIGFKDPRPSPKKAKEEAKRLQAEAGDGVIVAVPDNTGRYQIADLNQQDYDDRPAWFEVMRALEVLAQLPLPIERLIELTPDYRLPVTLRHARAALGTVPVILDQLESRAVGAPLQQRGPDHPVANGVCRHDSTTQKTP
jgi:hypothetical protein